MFLRIQSIFHLDDDFKRTLSRNESTLISNRHIAHDNQAAFSQERPWSKNTARLRTVFLLKSRPVLYTVPYYSDQDYGGIRPVFVPYLIINGPIRRSYDQKYGYPVRLTLFFIVYEIKISFMAALQLLALEGLIYSAKNDDRYRVLFK
jgi:hypothetical protein